MEKRECEYVGSCIYRYIYIYAMRVSENKDVSWECKSVRIERRERMDFLR